MEQVGQTWDHRVVRHLDQNGDEYFEIHVVHYDGDDDDSIYAWEEEPVSPNGDTIDDLKATVEDMLLAFDLPVLNEEDLPACEERIGEGETDG